MFVKRNLYDKEKRDIFDYLTQILLTQLTHYFDYLNCQEVSLLDLSQMLKDNILSKRTAIIVTIFLLQIDDSVRRSHEFQFQAALSRRRKSIF